MFDGLVVVDKPAGCTSHDVVATLRRIYGQRRVGHAGTLDPDATGLLLVGLGSVTRLMRYLQVAGKTYRGRVIFGIATDTLDASGDVVEHCSMDLSEDDVVRAARAMTGVIEQVPPMVSAIKVQGKRLHELARRGEEIERAARRVVVDRFEVESFMAFGEGVSGQPEATVLVECSTGTYVRSLAADLGSALGGCAHLASLRRLRIGPFNIDEAATLEVIESDPSSVVLSPADALRGLVRVAVSEEEAVKVRHGVVFPAGAFTPDVGQPVAVVNGNGSLLAVYERTDSGDKPSVVLPDTVISDGG